MQKTLKYIVVAGGLIVLGYFILGYASSYIGWYGYKKWTYRVGSRTVEDSKKRGVFVRELNYEAGDFAGLIGDFKPFIEKGYKYGYHSSEETRPLENSNYPYQIAFNYRPATKTTVLIDDFELAKFDSCDTSWGYLKQPYLNDTIFLTIVTEGLPPGKIKVW